MQVKITDIFVKFPSVIQQYLNIESADILNS